MRYLARSVAMGFTPVRRARNRLEVVVVQDGGRRKISGRSGREGVGVRQRLIRNGGVANGQEQRGRQMYRR